MLLEKAARTLQHLVYGRTEHRRRQPVLVDVAAAGREAVVRLLARRVRITVRVRFGFIIGLR